MNKPYNEGKVLTRSLLFFNSRKKYQNVFWSKVVVADYREIKSMIYLTCHGYIN